MKHLEKSKISMIGLVSEGFMEEVDLQKILKIQFQKPSFLRLSFMC